MADADYRAAPAESLANGGNELLAAMTSADLLFLAERGQRRTFELDEGLCRVGEVAKSVFFVEAGVASVAHVEADGRKTEICLIGPEGFTGVSVLLDDGCSPHEIYSQSDPLQVFSIVSTDMEELVAQSSHAAKLLNQASFAQMSQIAANLVSAVRQTVSSRLARWLLMYRERLRSDRFEVTHAYMAIMIGTQRPKVTEALHDLEAAGAIASSRGLVVVLDRRVLEDLAGRGISAVASDKDPCATPPAC